MTGIWMFGKETVFQSKFDQNLPFSGADEKSLSMKESLILKYLNFYTYSLV